MSPFIKCALSLILIFSLGCHTAEAKNLGVHGRTYEIAEPDALKEIKNRAAAIDWSKYFGRDKLESKVRNYKPKDLKKLPVAHEDRVRLVDMTWTLPFDIPDATGKIAIPKGTRYNPAQHRFMHTILVVIDGNDRRQVEWLKSLSFLKDPRVRVLLSDGNYYNLAKELKMAVFYANGVVVDRFQIEAVPSIVVQKGPFMEVSEYSVGKES